MGLGFDKLPNLDLKIKPILACCMVLNNHDINDNNKLMDCEVREERLSSIIAILLGIPTRFRDKLEPWSPTTIHNMS